MRRSTWLAVLTTAVILGAAGLVTRPLTLPWEWTAVMERLRPLAAQAWARFDDVPVPLLAAGAAVVALFGVSLAFWLRPRGRRLAAGMIRRGRPMARVARRTGLSRDALRSLSRRNPA